MSPLVREVLEREPIEASAPCRLDAGGTWDIKAMALPVEWAEPVTLNIAVDLRTTVSLLPFKEGWIQVSSEGFPVTETYAVHNLPFNSPLGLFFAAASHFDVHGLHVRIRSDAPVRSALGGSSTALVALINALSKLTRSLGKKGLGQREILHLAYHLEDGISGGHCGLQDQAAALYGGVNLWKWTYGHKNGLFQREKLLSLKGQRELSHRILVAFSGKSHSSSRINRSWIEHFLSGATRSGWIEANEIVRVMAVAIKAQDWDKAADLMGEEMAIRKKITPNALIPITERLIQQAEDTGCGARFTGAGSGGSVWALGERNRMGDLKKIWSETLRSTKRGRILDCAVDPHGTR